MSVLSYLKTMVSDRHIASITPSSRFTVARILRKIDFPNTKTIVEYGPGLGVISRDILSRMNRDARLIMYETNDAFVDELQTTFTDSRVSILHKSAELVLESVGEEGADYIVSGIPFSMIPPPIRNNILQNTARALKPGGKFITYQVFPPPAQWDSFLRKPMEQFFNVEQIEYEFLNIPPLRIYTSTARSLH